MEQGYENCTLCPRNCGTNRRTKRGYCGGGEKATIAKIMLHHWEEPPISGVNGSGAVFFSGCNLRCNYCQNRDISFALKGRAVDARGLADIFLQLQSDGAHNINLVTAAPYLPTVTAAIRTAKTNGLTLPIIYNTGGYEKIEAVRALVGLVDVWLPDLKYYDSGLSSKYSAAPDYFTIASQAIDEMVKQTGAPAFENGMIKSGVIIRHLVLPGHRKDSKKVVQEISARWGGKVWLSLMRQYTPEFAAEDCDLKRRVTGFEYDSVLSTVRECGLDGFSQEADSALTVYTPEFE